MNHTRPTARHATYVVERLGGQTAEFLFWVLVARTLAPSRFGVLTIAFLAARYLGLIADWGALTRGARDVASPRHSNRVSGLLRHRTWLAATLSAAYACASIAVGYPGLAPLAGVVLGLGLNRDWIALGLARPMIAGLPGALQGTCLLGLAFVATSPARAATCLGVSYAGASLVSSALNPRPTAQHAAAHPTKPDSWMLIALLAIQVTSTADTILLGILATSTDAGIYSAAYRLPNAITALLGAVLAGYLPRLTSAQAAGVEEFDRLRARALRRSRVLAGAVLLTLPITVVAFPRVFGSTYEDGTAALTVLMVSTTIVVWTAPLHASLISLRGDRSYALLMAGSAISNMVLNLTLIPDLGAVGAALGTLGAQLYVAIGLISSSRGRGALPRRGG